MKVAIVHDWLVNYGGAERVVQALLSIYPDADIFTLVYDDKKMSKFFPAQKVHTSFMQKWPLSTKLYTKFLSFMPRAFESFDFSGYDLVICSSSSCAKGVITPPDVPHIAYIHTPMRYAWDLFFQYRNRSGRLTKFFMNKWMPSIRLWDYISSQRIDTVIANSNYIARRIKKYWNRDSQVIYPPVDTERLSPSASPSEDFYIVFSRFVPYKRIDLAIDSCGSTGRKLVVMGDGSLRKDLEKKAAKYKMPDGTPLINFTGRISDEEAKSYMQRARALIFCAEEDFGIIPVEAQACGCPVIAYGKGGALETVVSGKTGLFFNKQTVESVSKSLEEFESLYKSGTFNKKTISEHAALFSKKNFCSSFENTVNKTLSQFKETKCSK